MIKYRIHSAGERQHSFSYLQLQESFLVGCESKSFLLDKNPSDMANAFTSRIVLAMHLQLATTRL
jgi:hypothetical protein